MANTRRGVGLLWFLLLLWLQWVVSARSWVKRVSVSGSAGGTGAESQRQRAGGPSAWGRPAGGRETARQSERGRADAGGPRESAPAARQGSGGAGVHAQGAAPAGDPPQNAVAVVHGQLIHTDSQLCRVFTTASGATSLTQCLCAKCALQFYCASCLWMFLNIFYLS